MKLEVGMYIRTNKGEIAKIVADGPYFVNIDKLKKDGITLRTLRKIDILKASSNIIDILEVGDVIKLFMEDDIDEEDTNIFELIAINYNDNEIGVFNSDFQIEFFPIENLRGILTHEQMEQMEYKVGE